MSIIIAALWFIAGGFFAVTLMSCFALAKRADEQEEIMLAYMKEGCLPDNVMLKIDGINLQS